VSNPVDMPVYGTPSHESPPPPPDAPRSSLPPQPASGGRPPAGPGIIALRVVGGIVAVTLVLGATASVVASFFSQTRSETHEYTRPVTAVTVEASTGSITIRPAAAGSPVRVTSELTWSFGTATSAEHLADGRLDVEAQCSNGFVGLCEVSYDITVPSGVTLVLGTHTGTIEASGLTGDVRASTHTGSVELLDLRSQHVEASTSTGSVELTFASAPQRVTAETSTGSVEVGLPGGLAYDVSASTSTGSTDVTVPTDAAAGRRVQAHTSTGSVDVHPYTPGS
jgi:hypothetical protein